MGNLINFLFHISFFEKCRHYSLHTTKSNTKLHAVASAAFAPY